MSIRSTFTTNKPFLIIILEEVDNQSNNFLAHFKTDDNFHFEVKCCYKDQQFDLLLFILSETVTRRQCVLNLLFRPINNPKHKQSK